MPMMPPALHLVVGHLGLIVVQTAAMSKAFSSQTSQDSPSHPQQLLLARQGNQGNRWNLSTFPPAEYWTIEDILLVPFQGQEML
jgi:hypothetical protein